MISSDAMRGYNDAAIKLAKKFVSAQMVNTSFEKQPFTPSSTDLAKMATSMITQGMSPMASPALIIALPQAAVIFLLLKQPNGNVSKPLSIHS